MFHKTPKAILFKALKDIFEEQYEHSEKATKVNSMVFS